MNQTETTSGFSKFLDFIQSGGEAYYSGMMFCNEWLRRTEETVMFLDGAAFCVLRYGYVIVGVQTSLRDLYYRVALDSIETHGVDRAEPGELELLDYLAGDIQQKAREALAKANSSIAEKK